MSDQSTEEKPHSSPSRRAVARKRKKKFSLMGQELNPGEARSIEIPLAPLVTGDELAMSARVIVGKREGPVMLLTAAVHGDEINGVEIIRRVLRSRLLSGLRGVLIAIPVVNVHGFLVQTRYLPDGRDLNRMFPGSSTGSLASRVAHKFVQEVLTRVEYGLDLHTGARHRTNLPQLRVDLEDSRAKGMAQAFGVPVVLHSRMRDGSLRAAAAELQIPMMVYEAGESLRFDEFSTRVGVRGVFNVLHHLNMLPRRKRHGMRPTPLMTRHSTWVRAPGSGMMRALVGLGSKVGQDETVAIIGDPMGQSETIVRSREEGIIIGKTNLPVVSEGDALFHVACYRERSQDAEQAINQLQETVAYDLKENLLD